MPDSQIRFGELISALKGRDFRLTPKRVELVRLIASSEGHPSAAQLYTRFKRKFPTMSHATVYKTLVLLKNLGQVLEIDLRDDSHYDGNRPEPHPHLICIQCNKIIDGRQISILPRSGNSKRPRVTRSSAPRFRSTGFARIVNRAVNMDSFFIRDRK